MTLSDKEINLLIQCLRDYAGTGEHGPMQFPSDWEHGEISEYLLETRELHADSQMQVIRTSDVAAILDIRLEASRRIPNLFCRDDFNITRVNGKKNPACQWVFDGEGDAYELKGDGSLYFDEYTDIPQRSHLGIRGFLSQTETDGILFVHPDGRKAKVMKSDFGLPRKPELE